MVRYSDDDSTEEKAYKESSSVQQLVEKQKNLNENLGFSFIETENNGNSAYGSDYSYYTYSTTQSTLQCKVRYLFQICLPFTIFNNSIVLINFTLSLGQLRD